MESENIDVHAKVFKNTVEELFFVSEGMDRPYVDVIDESIIYTLGSSTASFYDAGGKNIVNYLDPEQKSALLDAAAKSGILYPVKPFGSDEVSDVNSSDSDEGWNVAIGEDTFDFYDIIKSSYYNDFDKNKFNGDSVDPIYVFEFLDWLGFFNCTNEKVQIKIRHTIYDEIIGMVMDRNASLLDNSYKYAVNKGSFKTMTEIENKYFDILKKSIENSGFSDKVFEDLSFFNNYFDDSFERKNKIIERKKELYNVALRNVSTLVVLDNNHLFIPSFRNMYKYFGEISRTMETVLDVYISKKLNKGLTEQKDVIDLFTALGVRSNITDTGHKADITPYLLDESFDNLNDLFDVLEFNNNSDKLPEEIKKSVLETLNYYQYVDENPDSYVVGKYLSIDAIRNYIDACRAFFGDDFNSMRSVDSAVKSLEEKENRGDYINSWDSVELLTEGMSSD
ncbi:MAG: hypothetical protein KAJ56_03940, partial [Candidatus Aenigmarchaeota archaeon]|nr:hypothetical protein [Candidatus Aenigmarchaeota archaeon]